MAPSNPSDSTRGERVNQIIAAYLKSVEDGSPLDRRGLLAQHPDLAEELTAFFADRDRFQRVAGPLQAAAELFGVDAPTLDQPSARSTGPGTKVRYFGDYELLEEIARGGMGVVYKARQVNLKRIVALKLILAGQLAGPQEVARFHAEAEAAARLDHPGIVPIFEIGEHKGQHYFSMAFVEGESLARRVAQGVMEPREAAALTKKVAEAIAYAHVEGVVHRDLKPGNVLIDKEGSPRVTDFGLAKRVEGEAGGLTATGEVLGTPSYMPPEQAMGDAARVGPLSDVYSLGAILYCLLTGRPPFQAANAVETVMQVVTQEPVGPRQLNPAVPRDLETITLKCLEKDPSRRYQSAQELSDELQRYLDGRPIHARPVGTVGRTWRWCRRNRALAATIAAAACLIFAISVVYVGNLNAKNVQLVASLENEAVARQQADTNAQIAEKNAQRARQNANQADANAQTAERNAERAEDNARQAYEALEREKAQRLATERQGRVANALRLAAQSQQVREEHPQQALLLAVEALQTTLRHGEPRLADAETALRDALATAGGRPLPGHAMPVSHLLISPDGRWLASASRDRTVRLWDLTAEDPAAAPFVLAGQGGSSGSEAFSPDSRWLATAGWDKVRLWDLTADDPAAKPVVLAGPEEAVFSVAISGDNRWLATASWTVTGSPGKFCLRDLTVKDPAARPILLPNQGRFPRNVAISPDNHWLATWGEDCKPHLWDLTANDPAAKPRELSGQTGGPLSSLAISADSRWLVGWAWRDGLLWDLTTRDPAATAIVLSGHTGRILGLALSADSRWLATAGEDRTARLWDLTAKDPAATCTVLRGHTGTVRCAAISADGRWAATGSEDRTARLWDCRDKDPAGTAVVLRGHDEEVHDLALSPDGRWLATACPWEPSPRLWDLTARQPMASPKVFAEPHWGIACFAVSADGRRLIAASGYGKRGAWDLTAKEPAVASPFVLDKVKDVGFRCVTMSADGRWLAAGNNELDDKTTVRVWDFAAKEPILLRGHTAPLICVTIGADGRRLVSGSADKTARVWDLAAKDPAATGVVLSGHVGPVLCAAVGTDGHWLATGSEDKTARLWDLTAKDPAASSVVLRGHAEQVRCAAISPDGRWLATGSLDKTARLWDLTAKDPAASSLILAGSEGAVWYAAFSPNGRRLVTGHSPEGKFADGRFEYRGGNACVWDLTAKDPTAKPIVLRGGGYCRATPAFSADSRWLVTGGDKDTVNIWDLSAKDPGAASVVLRGHEQGWLSALAITPDGRWVATAARDTVRLWPLRLDELIDLARRTAGRESTPAERKQYFLEGNP